MPYIIVEEERKRVRDDDPSDESTKKRTKGKDKLPPPVSSATYNKPQPAKLRKERLSNSGGESTDDEGKEKKKKNSMFECLGVARRRRRRVTTSIALRILLVLWRVLNLSSKRKSLRDQGRGFPMVPFHPRPWPLNNNKTLNIRNAAAQMEQGAPAPSTPDRSTPPQVSVAHSLRQRDQQYRLCINNISTAHHPRSLKPSSRMVYRPLQLSCSTHLRTLLSVRHNLVLVRDT